MPLAFYYHRDGLQTRDPFFGDQNQINTRSVSLGDEYPAKILLEAERRYGSTFAQLGIEKLSMLKTYHYTLCGYNGAGWMTITLEMEAGNNDGVFPYGQQHWNYWLAQAGAQGNLKAKYFFDARDHVEWEILMYNLICGQAFHIILNLRTDATCAISSDPDESPLGDNVVDYPWAYLTSVVAGKLFPEWE
ncbi:hypothetical protein EDD18DRAFT_1351391 [Armillaria luteobubalina]|uniref:Uncharacterized protein n=1 Tax=Armillaria luteobubalina TaxID=153913 RepID=A0AA39UQ03_9AGAR|nr:hypothetical protein EDD18DRAFT_1351391 [Armillaria luteobubalina]